MDPATARTNLVAAFIAACLGLAPMAFGGDVVKDLQRAAVAEKDRAMPRAFHFGSQGAGGVFSNHRSHTNRLIPFYTFGRKLDPGAVTGKNSRYRTEEGVKSLFGRVPDHTVNPEAEYADQSDLYSVQRRAVDACLKHLFILWFDGMDWETTRAAAIAKSGKVYDTGKGSGLLFQDFDAAGSAKFGAFVTSPTFDRNNPDLDHQTIAIDPRALGGGYDPRFGGPDPWTPGPLLAKGPGYLKGQSASKEERAAVEAAGGVLHAYTDSAPSAGEFATGVKSYNNGINVTDDGRFIPTLFNQLQARGWKVGTVTSVPFDHASPAAFYAHNVNRNDFQDLARDMLGLRSIAQETGKDASHPGLDVVLGAGVDQKGEIEVMKRTQGSNAEAGNVYIVDDTLRAIDARNGGNYVVVQTEAGVDGGRALRRAADRAVRDRRRLFGLFGPLDPPPQSQVDSHLPYRTADGRYDPVEGISGKAESYTAADRNENPTLADMTEAALTVLSASPDDRFALFVEAGDVDFALHDNNLDNAVGAVLSGEEALGVIFDWIERHGNWDDSAVIVAADHGHYLLLDEPSALAGPSR
ncbi:MAG TPA: alkaline phosphatase [Isosphaeraceae bacterium]|jgi:alkaline phosphatase|nr:alkaline phosphatase [Isosphaeraceae bacterium]